MAERHRRRRALVLLLALLLVASVGYLTLRPHDARDTDASLRADQHRLEVPAGGSTSFRVDTGTSGSTILAPKISASGAPAGSSVDVLADASGAVVSVHTSPTTPIGTTPLHAVAQHGSDTEAVQIPVVVTPVLGFTMTLAPASATVVDGESTTYALTIKRGLFAGPIAISVAGLPRFATATVSPSVSLLKSNATIRITAGTNVLPGTYPFTVTGRAPIHSETVTGYLVVLPQTYPDFPITGSADQALTPGGPSGAVNLAISNPFDGTMTVTGLGVTITGTDVATCDVSSYAVTAYAGPASLTIPAHSTRTLADLGIPRSQWPQISMANLPTSQDSCKGAVVQLHFSAHGSGA